MNLLDARRVTRSCVYAVCGVLCALCAHALRAVREVCVRSGPRRALVAKLKERKFSAPKLFPKELARNCVLHIAEGATLPLRVRVQDNSGPTGKRF